MPCKIVILGAGISGLSAAWFLKKTLGADVQLTLIEKAERAGGWIQTLQSEEFIFEQGPRSCRSKGNGRYTLGLVESLGLQEQILTPDFNASQRFIYDGKSLQKVPKNLWEIPFNPLTKDWLKALWRDMRMPIRQTADESIHCFFSRRLGKAWADRLIDPFVLGIYAGNSRTLSLKSCFPLFDEWEQTRGSLLWGGLRHQAASLSHPMTPFIESISRFPLFSFREGMETLTRALSEKLQDHLFLQHKCVHVSFNSSKGQVGLENGQIFEADYVISTLPAFSLSSILGLPQAIADPLNELEYATLTSVNLGFNSQVLPFHGFGYLVPSALQSPVLGCIWDSSIFPQQNKKKEQTRLTLMLGGSLYPEVHSMTEEQMTKYASKIIDHHMEIRAKPQIIQIKLSQQAIPQYKVGHALWKGEVLQKLGQMFPHLLLTGSTWAGVSMNDCVAHAFEISKKIAKEYSGY